MKRPDVRPAILQGALFGGSLTYAERMFMVTVVTIKAEFIDGERRHGSRAMDERGHYSLHLDYLAGAMTTSAGAVKKLQRSLVEKEHLSRVHPGQFGRPSRYQALDVRGAKNGLLTGCEKVTPYGLAGWVIRGALRDPLTYKTHDDPDHPPTSGASPHLPNEAQAAPGAGAAAPRAPAGANGCEAHLWQRCPDDCRNAPPATDDGSRRHA